MRILYFHLLFLMAGSALAQDFTYENLVDVIKNNNVHRIEEVLPLLPPEFRSHYSLMRVTRSLQEASDTSPRVIMFGRNAKFTCAFNGSVEQRGGDSLECFQFRDLTDSFDFRQIQFPSNTNNLSQVEFSESGRTVDKKISCLGCHTADPRPNWNTYSFWQGAYGASDDVLQEDAERYKNFIAIRDTHPRYQWLIQGPGPFAPYMDGAYFDIDHRPNLVFSEAIGRMMGLRDLRILKEKLGEIKAIAFAVTTLQCLFNDQQKNQMKAAGVDWEKELDLAKIFGELGVSARFWSTVIFDDKPKDAAWDHQFGYSFLKEDVTMATVQSLAQTDLVLRDAIQKIKDYFETSYKDPDRRFYRTMNETVVGLNYFGGGHQQNRDLLCPRMAEVFVERRLQQK